MCIPTASSRTLSEWRLPGSHASRQPELSRSGAAMEGAFADGLNHLRAIAVKQGVTLTDELALTYQTEPWGDPSNSGSLKQLAKTS